MFIIPLVRMLVDGDPALYTDTHTVNDSTTYDNLLCSTLSGDSFKRLEEMTSQWIDEQGQPKFYTRAQYSLMEPMKWYTAIDYGYEPSTTSPTTMACNFQVNDRVVIRRGREFETGNTDSVTARDTGGYCLIKEIGSLVHYDCITGDGKIIAKNHMCSVSAFNERYSPSISSPPITMSIVQAARDLLLSAKEKLFRKVGFKDSCGNFTPDAKTVFIEELMRQDEAEKEGILFDLAKKMDKEAEERKGSCHSCC